MKISVKTWIQSAVAYWKSHKWIRKTAAISGISFLSIMVLMLVGWMIFRGSILNWGWNKAVKKLDEKGYTLTATDKGFSGMFTISLSGLSLKSPAPFEAQFIDSNGVFHDSLFLSVKSKSLFSCNKLEIGVNILKFWDIGLGSFSTDKMDVNLVNLPNYCNYCGLASEEDDEGKVEKKSDKDPIVALFNTLEKWVGKSPNRVSMLATSFSLTDTTGNSSVGIPKVDFNGDDIIVQVQASKIAKVKKSHLNPSKKDKIITGDTMISKELAFQIVGEIDKDDLTGDVVIEPLDKNRKIVSIPLILNGLGFKKGEFKVIKFAESGGKVVAQLSGSIDGFQVNDGRISDTMVQINGAQGSFNFAIRNNEFELDSSSYVQLNKIKTHIYARWQGGSHPIYALGLHMPELRANDFFNSLPTGLFRNIGTPKATGSLEYRMRLVLEDEHPQDVILESEMKASPDFKIIQWGNLDPRMINNNFTYTFYDKGKEVAKFDVGYGADRFVPIDEISPKLVTAVMKAEDPDFYYHKGFYIEAFQYSIAKNYKLKRFANGGSTISMQLVKNVFLGRRKTIARKIEEILFTWLIENQRVVSKKRMLEVYLNIIEWGPGLFGANDAARFYFGKHPSELNWGESAFLAGIIPRPKSVLWMLDSVGCVRSNWGKYKSLGKRIMARDSGSIDTTEFQVCILPSSFHKLKGKKRSKDTAESNTSVIPMPIDMEENEN